MSFSINNLTEALNYIKTKSDIPELDEKKLIQDCRYIRQLQEEHPDWKILVSIRFRDETNFAYVSWILDSEYDEASSVWDYVPLESLTYETVL